MKSKLLAIIAIAVLSVALSFGTPAYAESVYVKYRGNVDLVPFNCA